MTELMKAWRLPSPGHFETHMKLHDDVPRPTKQALKSGQIIIKVVSASLNPADYKAPLMGAASRLALSYPRTLGMDLAGQVAAVADGVTDVKVGDSVVAFLTPRRHADGALSEFVVAGHDEYAPLAADTDLDQASGLGVAALTAYQTITPHVKAGHRVFLNGGSGGTGSYGIQVAKILGCHVTVTCSPGKVDLCKALGADETIDYRNADVIEALKASGPYDLVVDLVGNSPPNLYVASSAFMTPSGKFVWVADSASMKNLPRLIEAYVRPSFLGGGRNRLLMYLTYTKRQDLEQLAQWLVQGKLRTAVDSTDAFEDAKKAFRRLATGSAAGKVIVHVSTK
ncbi:NADPH:quinone reductase [Purpureocillium takamizusanense]|uniref:NADPH:quinone reductase n=1 Tax=Purpureocillium takamizusanense TaxID=2060973 RepID=A0A9Q8V9Q4_9HYPO|nr:NADPH:quinone reductase [Purpureocillium takamizusanense]UNI17104.1 NADPH:quinone reductase [Purpureocillium takamizusanense]